jgi:hypothetical protein
MSRIPGVPEKSAPWLVRLAYRMARRRVGKVPEPIMVTAHSPWIFRGMGAFELALERARRVDPKLKALAGIKAAALVGCPF